MLGSGYLPRGGPGQLSGGQQQRVALGRAIVAEAPVRRWMSRCSNLDAQLRADMRREILALQRRLGITDCSTLRTTMTRRWVWRDQVVLLRDGISSRRPPDDAMRTPATTFAAEFHRHAADEPVELIGKRGDPGVGRSRAGAGSAAGSSRASGPESLRAGRDRHRGAGDAWRVSRRADTVLACTRGDRQSLLARLPGRVDLGDGAKVRFAFDPADLHLFDAGTGRRLHFSLETRDIMSAFKATRRARARRRRFSLAAPAIARAQGTTEIEFYFPVAVGGPITKIIERLRR
jgi:sn-glycerol 3-phosphate transport system ATP-binding protein